ncbi:MAG: LamG domain-containing protein [Candidatus Micrarchaeota archaeon]|nr:LamG domain-containing protein [Candidatus Micrarchaeota archaeon]
MSARSRLQSAMEYLMTYGWAVLAIAIVMVSLYSLGIFNVGSLKPTATPGSCQVIRTAAQVSLAGQCNDLIPRYVARFVGGSGASSYVQVPDKSSLRLNGPFTILFWGYINDALPNNGYPGFIKKGNSGVLNGGYLFFYGGLGTIGVPPFKRDNQQYNMPGSAPAANTWYFYAITYDGSSTLTLYENTQSSTVSMTYGTDTDTSALLIGSGDAGGDNNIADVQMYNTSLDSGSIKSLYQEGIGGAPIDVQHIVGWWPLNGNANDYSGNNNQGSATSVIWNANWQNGYTSPAS